MTDFMTSDIHFGHRNILKFCERPYSTLEDMETGLINNWNKVVGVTDTVYILGDVSFAGTEATQNFLMRLNGFKVFVWGNHDRGREKKILSVPGCIEGHDCIRTHFNGKSVILTHYPFESFREDFHFHGHTHGNSVPKYRRMDVGMDAQLFYAPVPVQTLMDKTIERDQQLGLFHEKY